MSLSLTLLSHSASQHEPFETPRVRQHTSEAVVLGAGGRVVTKQAEQTHEETVSPLRQLTLHAQLRVKSTAGVEEGV